MNIFTDADRQLLVSINKKLDVLLKGEQQLFSGEKAIFQKENDMAKSTDDLKAELDSIATNVTGLKTSVASTSAKFDTLLAALANVPLPADVQALVDEAKQENTDLKAAKDALDVANAKTA